MKEFTKLILYSLCIFNLVACTNKETKLIKRAASEINNACPIQIDHLVTLEGASYKPPKTIVYFYTININLFNSNTKDIEGLKESIKTNLNYNILYNENTKALKDIGVTLRYVYKTQVGKDFLDYTIDPEFYLTQDSEYHGNLSDEKIYKLLEQNAAVHNSQLPRQIGNGIELYKVEPVSPRTIEFIYRFNKDERSSIDTSYLRSKYVKDDIIASTRDRKNSDKIMTDNKVTFRYTYVDKHNIPITSIDVTPRDYK